MKTRILIGDIISAAMLLLLLYTALSKLADYRGFTFVLSRSALLHPFAGTIVWLLPASEIATVLLLFFPSTRLKGLYTSVFLLTCFSCYLGFVLLFSPDVPCNCGGVLKSLSWPQHIVFNFLFLALAITGIALYNKAAIPVGHTPP